jgi:Cell Wall Hydrolase/D-alanyl-D-alanine carboxypeptidase
MEIASDALDLMTRTLLGEADQTPEGWQALANVIKNRVNSRAWGPNTRVGPVLNANKQFTVWNNDSKLAATQARLRAIPTTDGNYQRAATVLQQVFNDQLPDNTGGATHYYAPKLMPNGQAPPWALGEQGRMIGSQIFYRLPLTPKNTENTILPTTAPSSGGPSSGGPESVGAGNGFAYGGESAQDQGLDLRHLEPVFRARIDKLMADAAAAGIKTHLTSGYRDNQNQAGAYARLGAQHLAAAPGQSYHQFGRAVDLEADNPAQQAALVALADQPERGITAGMHFATPDRVHFQAAEGKTAPLVGPGVTPSRVGTDANAPLGTASPGAPAVSTIVPNPANLPAPNAQAVSATKPVNPSAGFVGPGSDKYSVISSMTTGTSHNPQLTTAADWGHLGGAVPVAPPGAPAAAAPTPQPVLDTKNPPLPPERPAEPAPIVPAGASVDQPPSSPMASVVPNWGAANPNDIDDLRNPDKPTFKNGLPVATPIRSATRRRIKPR